MQGLTIGVVGGSLGGLTAACLLRDAGHDVTVYERSSRELEERGAGIGLLPETYRYLDERAGIDLATISVATDQVIYLNRDGSVAADQRHRYLFSSWNTVYRSLLGCLEQNRYLLGHELVSFGQHAGYTTAEFSNGTTRSMDLLVAADGIGSMVRKTLQPAATAQYAGYVAWRGVVPECELAPELAETLGEAITYYVYANSHILAYPIPGRSGSVTKGDRLINFVWYRNFLEGGELEDLLTDSDGVDRHLSLPPGVMTAHHDAEARATAEARMPPQLAALIGATKEFFVQVIYDIEVAAMAFGNICLLGDAAFAVRPHAAAGTAKAAEDAWVLTAALDDSSSVAAALATWERSQLDLGDQLLDRTRRIGERSQIANDWDSADPELIFGLYPPGQQTRGSM